MKKWTFQITLGNIALILLGTGIDLLGRWAAKRLFLPFWLDSVGTFLSAVLLGPLAGAISGGLMNVIVDFFEPGQAWFAIVSIGGGIAVGTFFPRDRKIESFSVIATALFAGFVMTVISTPINLYLHNGYVGHPWGDALVDMLRYYINFRTLCCVAGELLVNMPDKALSIAIALGILYLVRKHRGDGKKTEQETALALALTLLSGALLAPLFSVEARAASDFGAEYAAIVYGRESGLASAEINTIEQTADGYIWAGAYSGLYRYDGSRFEQIDLGDRVSNVIYLYEDDKNQLWIGTNDSGVACYRPDTGAVKFYAASDGLTADSVRSICEDGAGGIYVGTAAGLCRIDASGGIHTYGGRPDVKDCLDVENVSSLNHLGGGRIAGVTAGGELFTARDGRRLFSTSCADPELSYTAAAYDGGSELLVGTSGSRLFRFRIEGDGSLTQLASVDVPELDDINCLRYAPKEGGYFITAAMGFAFVDKGLNATVLTEETFDSAVTDVIVDYQDNVWFTSSKQGIMKLSYDPFLNVFRKAGLEEAAVNAILADGDRICIATDAGIDVLDAATCAKRDDPLSTIFEGERVRHLMRDGSGGVWVSTYGQIGLARVSPDGRVETNFGGGGKELLGNRFRFTLELSDGTVLAASTSGLNFIRDGRVERTLGAQDGLNLPKILCAAECPNGMILAGTDGDGIYMIRDERVVGHIGADAGLQSQVVMRIVPCGVGYIYVTSNALYFQSADVANDLVRRLRSFPYNNNYDVYVADDGRAWVSSSAGLYVTSAADLARDGQYRHVLLNYNRGFDTTLTANAWNAVSGDELYLCCVDGVRRVNTKTFDDLNDNYRIVMSSLLVENEPVEFRDGAYQIPAGRGRLQIRPAVLNYAISNPLVSMSLEGVEDPGIVLHQSEMNSEYYTTLPYGDFRVCVRVIDELTGGVLKEESFALHKEAELYEHTFYKAYLAFVSTMLIAFLTWMFAKMGNMAIINRQYEQIKEAKEEAEYANQAKSHFLAHMSHEIRTPINAVLGMDEMILRESTEKEIRGYASDIYTAGNTLLSLINDILDSSKIESGKMEIVPVEYELVGLIRDLRNMISQRAQAKDLHLELEVDAALPRGLYGDDVRIRQVVTNILTNAVKYTPSGTVWFRVGGTRDGEDIVLHVEVEDTGIGIREEDLPKLFEAYRRIEEERNRHIEGTGLGMNITIRLLAMMGSRLEVESVYGKGSRFFFDLRQKVVDDTPIGDFSEAMHAPEERYSHEGAFIAPDAHVLVVDDNAMNRKVFRSLLKVTRIRIDEAGGGAEALSLAESERYDMVFMDHMMPDMDGVETMQRMRKLAGYDEIPIYVLTANAVTGAKEQYLEAGFDGFISKPVVSDKLEQALRETLPPELLKPCEEGAEAAPEAPAGGPPEDLPTVDGLDWSYAWLHLPERELLTSTVREFREVITLQADKLDGMWQAVEASPQDADALAAYRIQVHGMKSAAATIGIVPLAGMAKLLEFAARDGETDKMAKLHGVFLAEWRSYEEKLREACGAEDGGADAAEKEPADAAMLRGAFSILRTALEDFDVDTADEIVAKLRSYACASEVEALIPSLAAAVADLDQDAAERVMAQIEDLLQ